ncbi:hypothetical protein [Flavobacterium sp.]|jgi:hypothetical protein|uniref:hypothetical protein n=1 Tax=Flavobacterium sp. TaxID=239 RepID=UPI0037BE39C9
MKKIVLIILLFPLFTIAQANDCIYEVEEKTDSTSLKVLPEVLIDEKIFGNTNEYLFFSLLNTDGVPMLELQLLQKSKDFIPAKCINKTSKIILQLKNGKIVTLLATNEEACSVLNYDEKEKNNIRVLTGYFFFGITNYDELKNSQITLMRIQFAGDSKEYVIKNELVSETLNTKSNPDRIFIDYLKCIE